MGNKIKDVIFILVLGSLCVALLLGMEGYTRPIIEKYKEITLKSTILDAAGIDYTDESLEDVFKSDIKKKADDGYTYYLTPKGFYIFEFKGRGLWGMITGVATLNRDMKTIESIKIISQEETPGLGSRIAEDEYLDQFRDKKVVPPIELAMRRKASRANEVDAISGASISSAALVDIINSAVEDFRKRQGK